MEDEQSISAMTDDIWKTQFSKVPLGLKMAIEGEIKNPTKPSVQPPNASNQNS